MRQGRDGSRSFGAATAKVSLMLAAMAALWAGACQPREPAPPRTDDSPPRPSLVVPGAVTVAVAEGYRYTQGPARDRQGRLYFTDIPSNTIHRLDPTIGSIDLIRSASNAANGLAWHPQLGLVICEQDRGRVARLDGAGRYEVLAARFNDRRFNGPNDLAVDARGGVYFSDPHFARPGPGPQPVEAVYYQAQPGGEIKRVADDLTRPTGLALSPDDAVLYISDTTARIIYAAPLKPDGTLGPLERFAEFDRDADGGPAGLTVDTEGRLYAAGQGHIWIFSPDGTLLERLAVPEPPSNCAFAGPENRDLFITARTSVYRIRLRSQGLAPD